MPAQTADQSLDDVQVLGVWNFTLQGDTPLHWLRSGALDRYLLRFRVHTLNPSTCGLVLHAEVDGQGADGASFWVERRPGRDGREGTKRYMVAGEGLDSKPVVTRAFPDPGGEQAEDVEVLMQGYDGTIFVRNRKVQIRFRTKQQKGSIAFYNSTQAEEDDVHFASVRITALRRGPLEVGGAVDRRERALQRFADKGMLESREEDTEVAAGGIFSAKPGASPKGGAAGNVWSDSHASTQLPCSPDAHLTGSTLFGSGALPLAGLMQGGGGRQQTPGQPKARLQFSASDSALRKSGGALCGLGPSVPGGRGTRGSGGGWVPLATNAPAGEQKLLQGLKPKAAPSPNACTDFIAM